MCCNSQKWIENYRWAKTEIPIIFFRRFKSKSAYHARCWVNFEKLLAARTILSMISRIILSILVMVNQGEVYDHSESYLKEGGPPNYDLANDIFPYAKAAFITFNVLRIVVFFVCLQWPHLAKLCLYFEYSFYVIKFGLVMDINRAAETMLTVLMIHIDFLLCYFDFAPGLIASLFALVLNFVKRAVFF